MLPAGKTKKEIALQLAEQGMKAPEIAKKIDAKYSTVYNWLNPDARPGWNADRKKCKTCRYRQAHSNPTDQNKGNCNYIEIAGHSRGCAVEDCDRYVKGERMERKRKCTKI